MSGPTPDKARLGVPDRWMYCPKSGKIVGNRFFPFKTPLCGLYDDQIEKRFRFHPDDVFNHPTVKGKK
uniref:YHS domain-containing protein n=1 Tax=Heterorhabditis bacteriophora TaxID=37862 RepID=A0A1I7XM95_HETBA